MLVSTKLQHMSYSLLDVRMWLQLKNVFSWICAACKENGCPKSHNNTQCTVFFVSFLEKNLDILRFLSCLGVENDMNGDSGFMIMMINGDGDGFCFVYRHMAAFLLPLWTWPHHGLTGTNYQKQTRQCHMEVCIKSAVGPIFQ